MSKLPQSTEYLVVEIDRDPAVVAVAEPLDGLAVQRHGCLDHHGLPTAWVRSVVRVVVRVVVRAVVRVVVRVVVSAVVRAVVRVVVRVVVGC